MTLIRLLREERDDSGPGTDDVMPCASVKSERRHMAGKEVIGGRPGRGVVQDETMPVGPSEIFDIGTMFSVGRG
jgi:hypothetical protein